MSSHLVDAKVAGPTPRWLESYDSYLGRLGGRNHISGLD